MFQRILTFCKHIEQQCHKAMWKTKHIFLFLSKMWLSFHFEIFWGRNLLTCFHWMKLIMARKIHFWKNLIAFWQKQNYFSFLHNNHLEEWTNDNVGNAPWRRIEFNLKTLRFNIICVNSCLGFQNVPDWNNKAMLKSDQMFINLSTLKMWWSKVG